MCRAKCVLLASGHAVIWIWDWDCELILYFAFLFLSFYVCIAQLGNTALDLSKELGHDEITDSLQSKTNKELDPLLPQFREWLSALAASEYLSAFVEAGYDLSFIATEGLKEEDLDCCCIPPEKLGLRRKLVKLHRLDEFFTAEEGDEDDEEEDDEDDEDDEEDEDEDDEDD